jgi:hypothetical protein
MTSLCLDILSVDHFLCLRLPERHGIVLPLGSGDVDAVQAWLEAQPSETVASVPDATIRRVRLDRDDLRNLPLPVARQLDVLF